MPYKTFTTEILYAADVQQYLMDQAVIRCTSSTRPSSPSEGWHIYETDTKRRMVYYSGTWRQEGVYETAIIKPETSKVDGWFTPVFDKDMRFKLLPNTTYWLEGFLMFVQDLVLSPTDQYTGLGWTFPDAGWKTRTCFQSPIGPYDDTTMRLGVFSWPEGWKSPVDKKDIGVEETDPADYVLCSFNFSAWTSPQGSVTDCDAIIKTSGTGGWLIFTWTGGWNTSIDTVDCRLVANSWMRIRRMG